MRSQSSALFLGYVDEFLRPPCLTGKPLTGNSGNYCTRRDLNVRRVLQVSRTDLATPGLGRPRTPRWVCRQPGRARRK